MFTVVRLTAGNGPGKPSLRPSMSGVNMQPVDLPRSIVRKHWEISRGRFASRSMEAAQHPEGGSKVSETAEKRQIRSEKSNKPSVTRLSVPVSAAISTDWNCMNPKKELPRDSFSRRILQWRR